MVACVTFVSFVVEGGACEDNLSMRSIGSERVCPSIAKESSSGVGNMVYVHHQIHMVRWLGWKWIWIV